MIKDKLSLKRFNTLEFIVLDSNPRSYLSSHSSIIVYKEKCVNKKKLVFHFFSYTVIYSYPIDKLELVG